MSLVPVPCPPGVRPLFFSARVARLLDELERAPSLDALAAFEDRLAPALELDDVLAVWLDWARGRAWSPRGPLSERLEELAPMAAGSGRRIVLRNAILEPIGAVPARMVLVLKGSPEALFLPHTLRTIKRLGARLAPTIERLAVARSARSARVVLIASRRPRQLALRPRPAGAR